jgi:hypothetical protein
MMAKTIGGWRIEIRFGHLSPGLRIVDGRKGWAEERFTTRSWSLKARDHNGHIQDDFRHKMYYEDRCVSFGLLIRARYVATRYA